MSKSNNIYAKQPWVPIAAKPQRLRAWDQQSSNLDRLLNFLLQIIAHGQGKGEVRTGGNGSQRRGTPYFCSWLRPETNE